MCVGLDRGSRRVGLRARTPPAEGTPGGARQASGGSTLLEASGSHPCTDHTMLAAGRAARWLRKLRTNDAADVPGAARQVHRIRNPISDRRLLVLTQTTH